MTDALKSTYGQEEDDRENVARPSAVHQGISGGDTESETSEDAAGYKNRVGQIVARYK